MIDLTIDVILQFNNGNQAAFHQVFNHFYSGVLRFIWNFTGNRQDAEEIAMNVFQKLFERCSSFVSADKIKGFLYVSARNRCISYLEKQKRLRNIKRQITYSMVQEYNAGPAPELPDALIQKVNIAVELLPTECRKIIYLNFYEGMKPREVAALLGLSPRTVSNQKLNGLKALRRLIPLTELYQ